MTNFDELRLGKAGTPYDTTNRPSQDNNVQFTYAYPPKQGVPTTPVYCQNVVPVAKGAANIAALQTPAAAGNLTLAASTGTTAVTLSVAGINVSAIALDCARCVTITGASGTVSENFTISGYDRYGQPMTQLIAGPTGATTVTTKKAFAYVSNIAVAAGTTAAISVGTSDVIGFDVCVPYYEATITLNWDGAEITSNTNVTAADATTPATSSTGDVRGTVNIGAINATNGTNRFVACIALLLIDTVTQAWGQIQA